MGRLDVPKYFRVSGRFWFDERAAKSQDDLKLFALYLLTNQHRTIEGDFSSFLSPTWPPISAGRPRRSIK